MQKELVKEERTMARVTIKLCTYGVLLLMALLMISSLQVLGAEPQRGGTLNVAVLGTIDQLDPQKSVMHTFTRSVMFSVYEPLVRYVGGEALYEPLLAEAWEFVDDKTVLFYLRKGVKFHDGSEFTAEDVVFTIERMLDPETAAPNRAFVAMIEEVRSLDSHIVQFSLNEPYGGLLTNLDYVVMLSAESPPDPGEDPIGTGPFKFVSWDPGDQLILTKFDEYWNPDLPYLDGIVYKPMPDEESRIANLEADEIQFITEITPEQAARIDANPNLKVIEGAPGTMLRVLIFVTSVPPMDDPLVRAAVAHAFDRVSFVEHVLAGIGEPTENVYSSVNPYWNPDTAFTRSYDLGVARELFEQAGHPDFCESADYPLVLTVPAGNIVLEQAAVMLQSSLRGIGVECRIERYDVPTWLRVRESKHMLLTFYSYAGVDPSIMLATNLIAPERNLPHYYSDELAELIAEGYGETDFDARRDIYFQIQEHFAENVPFTVLATLPAVGAARADLQGIWYQPSWANPIYHEAWLDR